jgi:hypothetical protein
MTGRNSAGEQVGGEDPVTGSAQALGSTARRPNIEWNNEITRVT